MHNDPVLSMLGIAAKSGNVVSGEFSTEKAVKTGHAYLVIVSAEASGNTKEFCNMTDFTMCHAIVTEVRKHLDAASEKEFRASLAVTDENLAKAVEKKLKEHTV